MIEGGVMREIRFRQPIRYKDGRFMEWHYWGLINDDWITPAILHGAPDTRKESQQFTGLHDKSGREIYEGDVISIRYDANPDNWVRMVVEWNDGAYELLCEGEFKGTLFYNIRQLEVIGNVFENADLLERLP